MTARERRATLVLALILLTRMLGLFMVLPVLSPWALVLAGEPGLAVGLAVGIYGLTQALLQIPLGWLSDIIGRRPVILGGLTIFVVGSMVAAAATTVDWLILGRLLQGGGAIAATSTALLADLLREPVRAIGLAVVGVSIGLSFLLALLLGPALMIWTGVPGLFWLAAALGVVAMLLLLFLPAADQPVTGSGERGIPRGVPALVLAVGVLHAMLAVVFVVVPLQLQTQSAMATELQWRVWLPVVAVSIVVVFPLLRVVETRHWQWQALPLAMALLAVMLLALGQVPEMLFALVLCGFFGAFNFLEASLPSMLSRLVGPQRRGRVMGVFSTAQFFGMFVGGSAAGVLQARWPFAMVLAMAAVLAIPSLVMLWLIARQAPPTASTSTTGVDAAGDGPVARVARSSG